MATAGELVIEDESEIGNRSEDDEDQVDLSQAEQEYYNDAVNNPFYDEDEDEQEMEEDIDIVNNSSRKKDWLKCLPPNVKKFRRIIWQFFDNDPSENRSKAFKYCAFAWSFFILALIVISIFSFMIATMPKYYEDPPITFFIIETFVVAVFTFELIVRICSTPNMKKFLIPWGPGIMNWIDFLAILPYYIELFFSGLPGLAWIRVVRLTRVFRVFKLGKYQAGFFLFYRTFRESLETLFLGLVFLSLGIILFSSFMFFAEQTQSRFSERRFVWFYDDDSEKPGEKSPYQSIPHTFWWCIVTMTTVGYGDTFPITPLGKTVAGITFLAGLVIIAFPIAILGNKFLELYLEQDTEIKRRKEEKRKANKEPSKLDEKFLQPIVPIKHHVEEINERMQRLHNLLGDLAAARDRVEGSVYLFHALKNPALCDTSIDGDSTPM